jgi:hypothetical protein
MDAGAQRAAQRQLHALEQLIHSHSEEELRTAASNPNLTEDLARALLARRVLTGPVLQVLAKNAVVMKHRSVLVGLVGHPHTPRFVALPLSRSLFPFELMKVALQPGVPPDLKIALEETLIDKLETMSLGERISLAKRGSTRVAQALLVDKELRVVETALLNPFLTEACIIKTLMREDVESRFVELVARHTKWGIRSDVRYALLRNPNTPLAMALRFAQTLPADVAREALFHSNLPNNVKAYLLAEVQNRLR